MPQAVASPAEVNRQFAERTLLRAADIVCQDQPFDRPDAVDALLQAKAELLAAETAEQKALRTYGASEIIPDFGQYIATTFPKFNHSAGFGITIGPWCRSQSTRTVAETLCKAYPAIGAAVARRTTMTEQLDRLNDREMEQLLTLDQFHEFLTGQGITADVQWHKPNEAYPAEFYGLINDARWSFAVTQLTHIGAKFAANSEYPHHPVQSAIYFAAILDTRNTFRTGPGDALLCLVIHNREFIDPSQWTSIRLSTHQYHYDAIAVMHDDDAIVTRVWQVEPANCFGPSVPSRTVQDLAKAVQRRPTRNPNINPEHIRRAWAAVADAGLTDADIRRIAKED